FMGYVPNDEYISWVKENPVDLFITTSSTEGGVPVSLSEMASFGIPCIATDVGGIPEIVTQQNGTLLSSNPTAAEVAQAITDFYHLSSEERKQKGDNSYKLWQNSFNSETNAQRVVEMLKQI
ncbi:MAG: glycosyltransferase, partial [Oscillospiraceae bacterium]|nr:glycosyltransferase [Oscillospiraceae bacterium]